MLESFGEGAVAVREIPALLGETDVEGLVKDLTAELRADGTKAYVGYGVDSLTVGLVAICRVKFAGETRDVVASLYPTAEEARITCAIVDAAAARAKPIALTGLAAMLGAFFILDDPIFNGLAIALVFGILVSTLLTLVVIPVLYYAVNRRRHA